jgi:hypothetical protein
MPRAWVLELKDRFGAEQPRICPRIEAEDLGFRPVHLGAPEAMA